jgi:hypothetical protein
MDSMTPSQLKRLIESEICKAQDHRTAMLDTVRRIAEPDFAYALLTSILCDGEWLGRTTEAAFSHPNGFEKLTLVSSSDPEYRLRLHVWTPSSHRGVQEHVHDHSWDYSSALLAGSFRMQTFSCDEKGTRMLRYECGFPETGEGYRMRLIGKSKVVCT